MVVNSQKKDRPNTSRRGKIIFLLGAGASVDAGLPTVATLTLRLQKHMSRTRDVNGKIRPEFKRLFDCVCRYEPRVSTNYERFFEWIEYLLRTQKDPFTRVTQIRIGRSLLQAAAHFAYVARGEIVKAFPTGGSRGAYLSRLVDFVPTRGRLDVFSLNYDCCLAEACARSNTFLTTGFDSSTKRWKPQLFNGTQRGINLYKLHGSLRWFGATDSRALSKGLWSDSYYFMELRPADRRTLRNGLHVSKEPTLILGSAPKMQSDDPFLTLFYEFHRRLRTICNND